ncbi:MAG: hypothetical protein LW855_05670 [Alphaproteobacteria bacterium]|jgi:hypothetical protein|nr:hypothetical protein [Alphaproteobacteria bacterium]
MRALSGHSQFFLEKFKPQISGDSLIISTLGLSQDCQQDICQVLIEHGLEFDITASDIRFDAAILSMEETAIEQELSVAA